MYNKNFVFKAFYVVASSFKNSMNSQEFLIESFVSSFFKNFRFRNKDIRYYLLILY